MKSNLKKQDNILIASLIIFAIISGIAGEFLGWNIEIDATDFWQALLPALATIYFTYKTNKIWGGKLRQFLAIIGSGLIIHTLLWGVIVQWHISGTPPLLGLSNSAVYILLHGMSAIAFLLTAQGFRLFYIHTKEDSE